MDEYINDIQVKIQTMDMFEWMAWLGLCYVIVKQMITKNVVTFEANNPVREHRDRITTALFYVPFVSIACFHVYNVMRLFVMIMIFQGMGEYMQIVFMDRSKKKPTDYRFTTMDRVVQWLSIAPCIGFYWSHFLATALLYNVFFLIIMIYIIILIFSPHRKVLFFLFNFLL